MRRLIVFDDADLDKAVEGALASKFRQTPGRPVSAPIDCMFRTEFTIVLRKNSTRR
ncbi:succinate-semialdehyde dehydrogenase [Salmonella enterica subsp. enterica]|uniref:Succinate-semialdehyde dehydrogenase n=1 Tax=Salmonella enterica I TaxID=59201 RepID=A0A379VN69_SALET|nr:succinate-semialdehyde dehydrogenase [Salmonella enterica subsp. enterica]